MVHNYRQLGYIGNFPVDLEMSLILIYIFLSMHAPVGQFNGKAISNNLICDNNRDKRKAFENTGLWY